MATVKVEDAGGVRTITLNRPERRNALSPEMQEELIVALKGAEAARARVIVLAGEGEAFCAGLDLAQLEGMAKASEEEHRIGAERVARMFKALWDCDVPTIAAVHRAAIAGGTGLAMLCDYTIASPEASFGFTEVRIGFVPAVVGAYLQLLVGAKVARGLLLSGKRFDAYEALRVGLVNEVVEKDNLRGRVWELAEMLIKNSPESLRATKRMLRAQDAEWLDAALELAVEANSASRETADFREGVSAFLAKREPVWGGDE
jgi:methylglutaconyl-CoA hydratase